MLLVSVEVKEAAAMLLVQNHLLPSSSLYQADYNFLAPVILLLTHS